MASLLLNGGGTRKVVILGDGAPWIWNLAEELFTDRVEIDWYHADENISPVARVVFGEGTDEAASVAQMQLDRLYEDAVDEVIEGLPVSENQRHRSKDEEIDKLTGYLERNGHRMKYRTFRQSGYYIGSGAVESAEATLCNKG